MRGGRTLGAIALALLVGFATPCVQAQHHGGGGGGGAHASAPHPGAPRQNYGRANGGNRANARAQARAQQGAGGGARGAGGANSYHAPAGANAYHPPAGAEPNREANMERPAGNPQQGGAGASGGNERSMQKLPPKWADNLRDRSPEEQQRFMQNNERFKSLPPAQQQQIRQNLQKWNSLSPTERNAIRDRQETWNRMSPDQRSYVQKSLLPKWQGMSPDRKALVTGRLHTLQQMNPDQRAAALNDPRFMQGLSPDEQSVLRGLDSVRNP
jgi:hypothetical protein